MLRRSGSILLTQGSWQGAEVRLQVVAATWEGVGQGYGLLRRRRVRVAAAGRGAAAVPRYAEMWLPGPDGRIAPLHPDATSLGEPNVAPDSAQTRRPALRIVG